MVFFYPIKGQYKETKEAIRVLFTFVREIDSWTHNNTEFFMAAYGTKKHNMFGKPEHIVRIHRWKKYISLATNEVKNIWVKYTHYKKDLGIDPNKSILDFVPKETKEMFSYFLEIKDEIEKIKDSSEFIIKKKKFLLHLIELLYLFVENSNELKKEMKESEKLYQAQKKIQATNLVEQEAA